MYFFFDQEKLLVCSRDISQLFVVWRISLIVSSVSRIMLDNYKSLDGW